MVRFKNRYLLVELHPFEELTIDEKSTSVPPSKKARITDLIADKPPPSTTSTPSTKSFAGLTSTNAAAYIRQSLEHNFGIHAAALNSQSFSVKYCNARTGLLIIRSARDSLTEVWASISFLTGLPSEAQMKGKCTWQIIHVSGTMRAIQRAAIDVAADRLFRLKTNCNDEQQRQALDKIIVEVKDSISKLEA